MPIPMGYEGKIYRNTGNYASPTWNEIPNVRNVKINDSRDEVEIDSRAMGEFKGTEGGKREVSVEFEMINIKDDPDLIAIRSAYANRSDIELLALDGDKDTPGNEGPRFTGRVVKCERSEENGREQFYSIMIKPAYSANLPTRYVVPTP